MSNYESTDEQLTQAGDAGCRFGAFVGENWKDEKLYELSESELAKLIKYAAVENANYVLEKAAEACIQRAESLRVGSAACRQCAVDIRSMKSK